MRSDQSWMTSQTPLNSIHTTLINQMVKQLLEAKLTGKRSILLDQEIWSHWNSILIPMCLLSVQLKPVGISIRSLMKGHQPWNRRSSLVQGRDSISTRNNLAWNLIPLQTFEMIRCSHWIKDMFCHSSLRNSIFTNSVSKDQKSRLKDSLTLASEATIRVETNFHWAMFLGACNISLMSCRVSNYK